ncbi:hypothetical protein BDC45DRAFT_495781 [Circinella umbellata]|nr:hypothetical protein BDC45DRAFT_495781 [Circinella umbellata]
MAITQWSALFSAYNDQVKATTRLVGIILELEWTILTRFIIGAIVATLFSILYLVWNLRHAQKIYVVWESLNKPVIKLFRAKIFALIYGNINPSIKSLESFIICYVVTDIQVSTFSKGFCTAILPVQKRNRDQQKTTHSEVIVLLAQTVSDLALQSVLKKDHRIILKTLRMKYFKKKNAHDGLLTATSDQFSLIYDQSTISSQVIVKDYMLDTVAIANLEWNIVVG